MRSTAHINGHPVHPMVVGFPIAYFVGSVGLDLWARATGRPRLHQTARDMAALGFASAAVAALPGVVDYVFTVPPDSSARTRATDHALANVSALALFAAAFAGRRKGDGRPAAWSMPLETAAVGLMSFAGWLGGVLVHRNQIGVDHRHANAGKLREKTLPPPQHGTTRVEASFAESLEVNQMALLLDGEHRTVLARTERGLAAFHDRCTHKGGPLSDGALACGVVQCPWHGSQFDVSSGAVKQGPAEEPIATYSAVREGSRVAIGPIAE